MFFPVFYLVVQFFWAGFSHAEYTEVNRKCESDRPDHCYTLHRSTRTPVTWEQARELCVSTGETLGVLSDTTSRYVEQLIPTTSNTTAWIAGIVKEDSRWQTLNGQLVPYEPIEQLSDDDNCGYLLVDSITEFRSDSCTDYKAPLCEYDKTGSGCQSGDIEIGSVCIHPHLAGVSWYSAVLLCKRLGYRLMRYDPVLRHLDNRVLTIRNLWLDAQRYPWVWNKVSFLPPEVVDYFNWQDSFGANIPGQCMYIGSQQTKWRSQSCSSPSEDVYHFVCEKDTTKVKTGSKVAYIVVIPVVACLIVIVIIALIAFWCIRNRRLSRTQPRRQQESNQDAEKAATSTSRNAKEPNGTNPNMNMNNVVGDRNNRANDGVRHEKDKTSANGSRSKQRKRRTKDDTRKSEPKIRADGE